MWLPAAIDWDRNPGSAFGKWERLAVGEPFNNFAGAFDLDGAGGIDLDVISSTGKLLVALCLWRTFSADDEPGDEGCFAGVACGTGWRELHRGSKDVRRTNNLQDRRKPSVSWE
jgi:hypothetical protein